MIHHVRIAATAAALLVGFGAGYASAAEPKTAVFAGGCFWCVEADFDKVDGVVSTVSGFAGGTLENPTYKDVTYGGTGHYEVVEISYDPDAVSYRTLVDYFLRHIDPTDDGGQFCDRGDSYKTAIFAGDDEERASAQEAVAEADTALGGKVVTPVLDAAPFYPAEDYHQDYYAKNPLRYRYYRYSCGRDERIDEVWGKAKGT